MNKPVSNTTRIQWLVEFDKNIWILKSYNLSVESYIVQLSVRAKMSRLIWDPLNRNNWLNEIRQVLVENYLPKLEKEKRIALLEWISMRFLMNVDIAEYEFYTRILEETRKI